MGNKVEFGLKNLYMGTYTVGTDGKVTLGTPMRVPGAVSYSPEEKSELSTFHADDTGYYSSYSGGTIEGDLEVAKFTEEFKKEFLAYAELADGGIAQIKGAKKPNVYQIFEVDGDAEKRRIIMYNGTLGAIKREYKTKEGSNDPVTEKISTTFSGDDATGITSVSYKQSDAAYATLFTKPPVPALAEE